MRLFSGNCRRYGQARLTDNIPICSVPAEANSPAERPVLIDTSSWIHFLRTDGDSDTRRRVAAALESGAARWCAMIRLELWNGARGQREKREVHEFERLIPELAVSEAVWGDAFALARRCRTAGVTVPATNVLIAACAIHHGAELEHADSDFTLIQCVPR